MTRIAYNHKALSLLTMKPLGNKGPKWGSVHTLTGIQCNVLRAWYMTLVVSLPPDLLWVCCPCTTHSKGASMISLMVALHHCKINLRLYCASFGRRNQCK